MNQGNVRRRGRDQREEEVRFQLSIRTIMVISIRTTDMMAGIMDGIAARDAPMPDNIIIHQAHEQLLKNIRALLDNRLAV